MRILVRLLLLLLVLGAGLAGLVYALLPSAAGKAIEIAGREGLGVEARLSDMPLSLSTSTAALGLVGLELGNPPGFGAEPFFRVDEAALRLDLPSLAGAVVRVPELRLDGARLKIVQRGKESNVLWFLDRLDVAGESEPAVEGEEPAETEGAESGGPLLAVQRVLISGVQVSLSLADVPLGAGEYSLTLPSLDLDLSEAEPGDSTSLLKTILREVVQDSLEALGVALPPGAGELLLGRGDWKSAWKQAQPALEQAVKQGAEEKVNELVDEALKKLPKDLDGPLKGLLKKD